MKLTKMTAANKATKTSCFSSASWNVKIASKKERRIMYGILQTSVLSTMWFRGSTLYDYGYLRIILVEKGNKLL